MGDRLEFVPLVFDSRHDNKQARYQTVGKRSLCFRDDEAKRGAIVCTILEAGGTAPFAMFTALFANFAVKDLFFSDGCGTQSFYRKVR